MGGSSSSSSSNTPVEAPNTLLSNQRICFLDLNSEGRVKGPVSVSGVSGTNSLCSVYLDGVPVMNGDGSANYNISGQGFAFSYTTGTSDQGVMSGFEKVQVLIPLPANTRVANPPVGAGYIKNVVASFNTSTYPDASAIQLTMRVPALTTQDSNGNINGFTITYAVDISLNNGSFNTVDTQTIQGKCTSPYFKTTNYSLPMTSPAANWYEWKVRVRRTSQNILSAATNNELFVDSIAVISANSFRYPMSALAGLQITADQFGSVPTRSYLWDGIVCQVPAGYTPTQYNTDGTITPAVYPTVWAGDFSSVRQWTDNPAWILYDICTNKLYGLGTYIRPEWIDKWTLYQIAQICDTMVDDGMGGTEPQYTCNVLIQTAQDAYTLLNNLVSVFRGMLYWANGRLFPVGPETRNPVYNFTNANTIGGAFSYSDTPRNTRSTVVLTSWTDPNNLYRNTPLRVEDTASLARYGEVVKNITSFATATVGQATRGANWVLLVEQVLTETITFQTDLEGLYLRPGDVFNVYDNYRNNQQQGGRITNYSAARDTVMLDRAVNLQPGYVYTLAAVIPAANLIGTGSITGSDQISLIRNAQIETRTVTNSAASGINSINLNSGFSSGLFGGSTWILSASGTAATVFDQATLYRCLATSEPQKGTTEILGVVYLTGIQYNVNNNYSANNAPVISGDMTPPGAPTGLMASPVTGILNDGTFFSYVGLTWTDSVGAAYYSTSGTPPGGAPIQIGTTQTTGINYTPPTTGLWTFAVGAVNANGIGSAFNTVTYNVPTGNQLGGPPQLSGVYISANADSMYAPTGYLTRSLEVTWVVPTGANGFEVPQAQYLSGFKVHLLDENANTDLVTPVTISNPSQRSYTISTALINSMTPPRRDFKVYIETADTYGNLTSGASLVVNNPAPSAPIYTSFYAQRGGINYVINPAPIDVDVSGVYLWTGTPTRFDNAVFTGTSWAGFYVNSNTGNYSLYYAITDTWGTGNCPVYGPVTLGTNLNVTGIRAVPGGNPYLVGGIDITGSSAATVTQAGQVITVAVTAVTGISVTGSSNLINTINVTGNGPVQVIRNGNTIIISGLVNPPTYSQVYAGVIRTLSGYTPNIQTSFYAGIDSGVGGSPYAQVSDLNTLRTAYENVRVFLENNANVLNQYLNDVRAQGTVR